MVQNLCVCVCVSVTAPAYMYVCRQTIIPICTFTHSSNSPCNLVHVHGDSCADQITLFDNNNLGE